MAKSVEPDGSREPEVVEGNPKSRQTDKDSIRGTHQSQRSCAPHQQAGHMTASDQTSSRKKTLANRGPSTHVPLPRLGKSRNEIGIRCLLQLSSRRFCFRVAICFRYWLRHRWYRWSNCSLQHLQRYRGDPTYDPLAESIFKLTRCRH